MMKNNKIIITGLICSIVFGFAPYSFAQIPSYDPALQGKTNLDLNNSPTVVRDSFLSVDDPTTAEPKLSSSTTEPKPAAPAANVNAPVTGAKTTDLALRFTNTNNTEGFLGNVKLTFGTKAEVTIPDPPRPEGYDVGTVSEGTIRIIAKRAGYEIYDKNTPISATEGHESLLISMTPLPGTPKVDASTEVGANVTGSYGTLGQFPTGYNSNTWPQLNQNPSVLYPGQLPNLQTGGLYGNVGYPGQTTGLTADANAIIPTSIAYLSSNPLATGTTISLGSNLYFDLYDVQTQTLILSAQLKDLNLNRNAFSVACLKANSPYLIRLRNSTTIGSFSIGSNQYQNQFTTPAPGQMLNIKVLSSGNNTLNFTGNPYTFNITTPAANSVAMSIACPNGNQYSGLGQGVYTDQTINLDESKSMSIQRDQSGNYFVVNQAKIGDNRQITFVDSGVGVSGLAFFPASATNIYGNWYVTGYRRNTSTGLVTFSPTEFSRVKFSPTDYNAVIRGNLNQNF